MFDGDQGTLHEVEFQIEPRGLARRERRAVGWTVAFICGVVCAAMVAWLVAQ
jgi:hypothetical protein